MPPASAVNNNSNSLAAAAKAEREEKLRASLKDFILLERKRKQEEYETKCEEIRMRKEREARERENDITLEETRGEIAKLDEKLTDLHNQKQQLFLQLKKVLKEDENRKKQQKDELFASQQAQQQQNNIPTAQVFMPQVRLQHQQQMLPVKTGGNAPIKRGRSPSPPQAYYKNATFGQAKHDDARRGADYVLWNKADTQYATPGTLYYQTTGAPAPPSTQADVRLQPLYPYQPLRPGYFMGLPPNSSASVSKSESSAQKQPTQVFHINLDQPTISQADVMGVGTNASSSKPQLTMEKINDRYHIEVKHDTATGHVLGIPQVPEGVIYKPIIGELPLQIATNLVQNPKATGSITQGYAPGRGGPQQNQPPNSHYTRRLY